jgi:hypothetical protein
MLTFAIMEIEDGLTIIEVPPGEDPEQVAASQGGTLVDAGPFATYEDANDALLELEADDEDGHDR